MLCVLHYLAGDRGWARGMLHVYRRSSHREFTAEALQHLGGKRKGRGLGSLRKPDNMMVWSSLTIYVWSTTFKGAWQIQLQTQSLLQRCGAHQLRWRRKEEEMGTRNSNLFDFVCLFFNCMVFLCEVMKLLPAQLTMDWIICQAFQYKQTSLIKKLSVCESPATRYTVQTSGKDALMNSELQKVGSLNIKISALHLNLMLETSGCCIISDS